MALSAQSRLLRISVCIRTMMDRPTITVPVFPLPDIVFFPRTVLPLHVFEPRYKAMVADVLLGEHLIAVGHLKPGWQSDYHGQPAIYRTLGVGEIVNSHRWSDGRYDIVLEGRHRGRIISESMQGDYRVADLELLNDFIPGEKPEKFDREYGELRNILDRLLKAVPDVRRLLTGDALDAPDLGTLVDILVCAFVDDPYDRQSILDEVNVCRRLGLAKVQLRGILLPDPS
jgi:Lon protease-like protein